MRTIGLDVHKRFGEVAILEPGRALKRQRITTKPASRRQQSDPSERRETNSKECQYVPAALL